MKVFKSPSGEKFTLSQICSLAEKDFEYEIFVGTDSQLHKKKHKVKYVTCIVLYKKGRGGRIFLHSEWQRTAESLRERLTKEVWMSLETCFHLQEVLPLNAEIVVDLDLNKNPDHKSSDYAQALAGMVTSQGFKCRLKPHSWAAMSVADRYSK